MTPDEEAALQSAEKIVEYGKLYLQLKAEGKGINDLQPLDRAKVFKFMIAHRAYQITELGAKLGQPLERETEEEFIASREQRVKELRERK